MSALNIHKLDVVLGGKAILRGVEFEARGGEVTGLIGPNGAGKSTLLRALLGLVPGSRDIEVLGDIINPKKDRNLAKKIAYLPQLNEVHWPMTARAIISLGRYPHGGFFETLTTQDEAAIDRALKAVDGVHLADRNVLSLSAGERARILLARALAVEAPIFLADEPVASLDPEHQLRVMQVLKNLATQGRAVVIVLHDLTLAARFCDTLTLLDKGRVVASGNAEAVLTTKNLKKVYKITAKRGENLIVPWNVV